MTAGELVRAGVLKGAGIAENSGVRVPPLRGKLLRPLTALSFVPPEKQPLLDERFWLGCLAIQMVHEASICHYDVLDYGLERRIEKILLARKGDRASVLQGDIYLTGAYRVASMTGLNEYLNEFIETAETMVHGQYIQDARESSENHQDTYEKIVRMKSGRLFGLAAALPGWSGDVVLDPVQLREIGIEIGRFCQMVEDFLDYCPTENTDTPKLQNFHNHIWTFVLGSRGTEWFRQSTQKALETFFWSSGTPSMAKEALIRIRECGDTLVHQIRSVANQSPLIKIVEDRIEFCADAETNAEVSVKLPQSAKVTRTATRYQIANRASRLGDESDWQEFFARNSRSFSFASRFFPSEERSMITEIYLFCRFTDNLVDMDNTTVQEACEILDMWEDITYSAYNGNTTGIPVADVVMSRMARMEIPHTLVSELIEGMRMDVEPRTYRSMDDLRFYTHRVASVVGDWITRAFGVREPHVLERAHDLGHAMQLTNIVRDVGEDLTMGRIYLPADLMELHNITPGLLAEIKKQAGETGQVPADYVALLEEVMTEANTAYDRAYEGIPFLPARLRHAIAVAARVYRGIHDEVRTNNYNNLTLRARTSAWRKTLLARKGLKQLKEVSEMQIQQLTKQA